MTRLLPPIGVPTWVAEFTQSIERLMRDMDAAGFQVTATGTGASQNIALPKDNLVASDVLVFVSGALVTAYTISGRTLTITAASSAPIVIVER